MSNSRRNTLSKLEHAKLNSKWTAKPAQDGAKIDRTRLWESLNAFVMKHQARIVSPMHVFPIRLQVPPDSDLPSKLTQIGYSVVFKSRDSVVGGPTSDWRSHNYNTGYSFSVVETFELSLPRPSGDIPDKRLAVQ